MPTRPTSAPEPPYPRPREAWRMVAILLVASMFSYLDRSIITLLLPMIKSDLNINDTQFSLLQGFAFVITFAFAGMPMGWLADRSSRSRLIAFGVATWSIATVFCGLSDTYTELFLARMGVGFGEACLAPAAVSLISDSFPRERRGLVIGVMSVGTPLGSGLAKIIGGAALAAIGATVIAIPLLSISLQPWQMVFIIVGAPGLLVALACLAIREPVRREGGIVRSSSGESSGFLQYLSVHGSTVFPVVGAYTLIVICGYANASWTPIVFMRTFGLSPAEVGVYAGAAVIVGGVAAALCGGILSDTFFKRHPTDGRLRILLLLAPFMLVAFVVLAFSTSFLLSLFAFTAANFLTFAIVSSGPAALQEIAPNKVRGQLIAFNLLIGNLLGLGVAPTLVAVVTDYFFKDDAAVNASLGAVTVPAAAAAILMAAIAFPAYRKTRAAVVSEIESASAGGH